jgi:hypothetical protein
MIFLVPHGSTLHMTARILDGLKIRDQIFAELKGEITAMTASGTRPGLAAVLVGDNRGVRTARHRQLDAYSPGNCNHSRNAATC